MNNHTFAPGDKIIMMCDDESLGDFVAGDQATVFRVYHPYYLIVTWATNYGDADASIRSEVIRMSDADVAGKKRSNDE